WYAAVERIPEGPTTMLMQELAKKHRMVIVVPIYEKEITGVYYNTAAVIDADGKYLGKYRKNHIPQVAGFYEKFFFKPGNLGYPVFDTAHSSSASTPATIATSPRVGGRWRSTAPSTSSTPRQRWPGSANISGSSSSPPPRWPTGA